MQNQVSRQEAKEQVVIMAKRTAMLYQSFSNVLVKEFGKEKAKEIILESINEFGRACGQNVKKGVLERGDELTLSNYFTIPDLPKFGWDLEKHVIDEEKEIKVDVHYCPLVDQWLGDMDPELARLYCFVDQAKFSSYNPEIICEHTNNMLDGDEKCTLLLTKKKIG